MRRIGWILLAAAVTVSPLAAQRHGRPAGLREVRGGGDRGTLGLTLVVAEPWGDFKRHGDIGAGINFFGVSGGSGLGVRIEGGVLGYASEYQGYGISTSSSIGSLAIGPQLTIGDGPFRLYGFATLGGSLFWSSINERGCGCYDSDVFFLEGDFTTNRSTGAGMMLNLSSRFALDLGIRETRHDRVTYVPANGVQDNGDGTYSVDRVTTPVGMRVWHAGLTIGLR